MACVSLHTHIRYPGTYPEELAEKYYTFQPPLEYCKTAFELLLKRGLIRALMVFRGRTRYVIADPALNELMCDIHSFSEMENEFLYLKSQQSIPTFQEVQSRKVLYSDERKCERLFNIRDEALRIDSDFGEADLQIMKGIHVISYRDRILRSYIIPK